MTLVRIKDRPGNDLAPKLLETLVARYGSEAPNNDSVIDPKRRIVYHYEALEYMMVEMALHEIMHAAFHPPTPRLRIDRVCEGVLVLPMERQIARAIFTRREYKAVTEYQSITVIEHEHTTAQRRRVCWSPGEPVGPRLDEVGCWTRPTRSAWYRAGIDRAIAIGLLDERRRPTWKKPDWTRWRTEWNSQ